PAEAGIKQLPVIPAQAGIHPARSVDPFAVIPIRHLVAGPHRLALDRTLVMGIVNVTPDSFSDQGRHAGCDAAIAHARQLIGEGADIIDIGGESTRPGAREVEEAEELRRLMPVLEQLAGSGKPISVDTRKPAVMREAIA